MVLHRGIAVVVLAVGAAVSTVAWAKGGPPEPPKGIDDRVELAGNWIYDDVDKAFERAKRDNRPVLAVFR